MTCIGASLPVAQTHTGLNHFAEMGLKTAEGAEGTS